MCIQLLQLAEVIAVLIDASQSCEHRKFFNQSRRSVITTCTLGKGNNYCTTLTARRCQQIIINKHTIRSMIDVVPSFPFYRFPSNLCSSLGWCNCCLHQCLSKLGTLVSVLSKQTLHHHQCNSSEGANTLGSDSVEKTVTEVVLDHQK